MIATRGVAFSSVSADEVAVLVLVVDWRRGAYLVNVVLDSPAILADAAGSAHTSA
jgi:hypothetical protein